MVDRGTSLIRGFRVQGLGFTDRAEVCGDEGCVEVWLLVTESIKVITEYFQEVSPLLSNP